MLEDAILEDAIIRGCNVILEDATLARGCKISERMQNKREDAIVEDTMHIRGCHAYMRMPY